ncbi:uncharacterized protein MONOS_18168 [Monocercomonoides exilis]|uniref:uncharacterized protein n=1 Tax=Monocercomonoides exilis TaxID=2049356 RepID=UPI00355A1E09|nr:hypothetical protein MONOS_18168 [Monocercomonoides exilis]
MCGRMMDITNSEKGEQGGVAILPVDSAKADVCTFSLCSNTVGCAIKGTNKAEVTSCSCVVNGVMVKEAAAFAREAAREAEAALDFFFILEDLSNSIEEEEEVVEGEEEGEEEEEWKEMEEEEREKKKKKRRENYVWDFFEVEMERTDEREQTLITSFPEGLAFKNFDEMVAET